MCSLRQQVNIIGIFVKFSLSFQTFTLDRYRDRLRLRVRDRLRVKPGWWSTKSKVEKMLISTYLVLDREFISQTELRGSVYCLPQEFSASFPRRLTSNCAYPRQALSAVDPFVFLQINPKSHPGGIRIHGPHSRVNTRPPGRPRCYAAIEMR